MNKMMPKSSSRRGDPSRWPARVAAELPSGVDEKQGTLKLGMGKECATPLAEEEIVREGSLAVVCGLCAGRDAGTGRGRTWEYLEKGARKNRARCGHGMCYPGPSTQNRVGRQLYTPEGAGIPVVPSLGYNTAGMLGTEDHARPSAAQSLKWSLGHARPSAAQSLKWSLGHVPGRRDDGDVDPR